MSITSRQFIKSVRSRVVGDIVWQVTSQLIGVAVGAIFSVIFTPLGPLAGALGFMLGYGIANAIKAHREAKKNARMIASQTFYNEEYEGEITLSDKKAHDKLWGGTLPDITGWSTSGTYATVQVETDKHLFKGEIVLAKKGVKKTANFGLTNIPISLDYALQTRSYLMYSDFDSGRFNEYFFTYSDFLSNNLMVTPKDSSYWYMANSLMYLENAISQETNDEYNTIYPYMIYGQGTFVPTFQFAGSDTNHPVPEFYHEYPIYVEEEYYSALEDEDGYHTIYKVYDGESSQDIELVPEDGTHLIFGKVDHIDVYYLNSEGFSYQLINSPYYLDEGDYAFDNVTGILTLSDSMYASLHSTLDILENIYSDTQDYEGYYMFEVKIEKYRVIDPDNPIDNHIATMQAIEQSILEYTYQFKHAQKTQQGLSEMFYTFFVTSISTIFTTGITLGMGLAAKGMSATSKAGIGLKKYLTNFASIKSWQFLKLALSPLLETFQEIFVDPYLEIIVTDLVSKLGGDVFAQVFWSSMAEGAREGLTGPLSQFLHGQAQRSASSQISEQHIAEGVQNTDQDAIFDNNQETQDRSSTKVKWGSVLKSGASLVLGAALIGIGGPMFFGASLVLGFSTIKHFAKSFEFNKKVVKDVALQQVKQEADRIVRQDEADAIQWALGETMKDLAEESIRKLPDEVVDGYVDENGKYHLPASEVGVEPTPGQCCGAAVGRVSPVFKALDILTNAFRNLNRPKLIPYQIQFTLDIFLGKRLPDGSVNLRYYAARKAMQMKREVDKNTLSLIEALGIEYKVDIEDFFINRRNVRSLVYAGVIDSILDIISYEGEVKYGWKGFTYVLHDTKTGFYQVGLTKEPLFARFTRYLDSTLNEEQTTVFVLTGEKKIFGYLKDYLDDNYGLESFKNSQGRYNKVLVERAILKRFDFDITGVYWSAKSLALGETKQIAVGKVGTGVLEYQNWLRKFGIRGNSDPIIQDILNKYDIDPDMVGKALNDPRRSGHGAKGQDFIYWLIYYSALGYSFVRMHKALKSYHGYKSSLSALMAQYESFFGSTVEFRQDIIELIAHQIRGEGVDNQEILALYPTLRVRDKNKIIELMRKGLSREQVAAGLGYTVSYISNIVKEIIREQYPDLVMYKYTSTSGTGVTTKTEPSFEDLQAYLVAESILMYMYQGLSRDDIVEKFRTEGRADFSIKTLISILDRVIGGSFGIILDNIREVILTIIIMETNPKSQVEILRDSRIFDKAQQTVATKLNNLFPVQEILDKLGISEARIGGLLYLDRAKVCVLGPHLLRFYKLGYSDAQILGEFGPAFAIEDLEWLTDVIWGLTPDQARIKFYSGYLGSTQ